MTNAARRALQGKQLALIREEHLLRLRTVAQPEQVVDAPHRVAHLVATGNRTEDAPPSAAVGAAVNTYSAIPCLATSALECASGCGGHNPHKAFRVKRQYFPGPGTMRFCFCAPHSLTNPQSGNPADAASWSAKRFRPPRAAAGNEGGRGSNTYRAISTMDVDLARLCHGRAWPSPPDVPAASSRSLRPLGPMRPQAVKRLSNEP